MFNWFHEFNKLKIIDGTLKKLKKIDYKAICSAIKKRDSRIIKICAIILSVLIAFAIVGVSIFSHILDKANYGDIKNVAEADEKLEQQLDREEELDFNFIETTTSEKTSAQGDNSSATSPYKYESDYLSGSNIGLEIQKKANEDIEQNLEDSEIWSSDDVYNVLLAGYDAGGGSDGGTGDFHRSDAILIASFNKVKKSIRLISLSRATYAAIPGHGNKRLNTAHAYGGASLLVETIESNYKVKIDRYVTVSFDGFVNIIDSLDGVTLDLTKTEAEFVFDDTTLSEGSYKMNGKQALRYVRLRKTDSDRVRTGRQRNLLNEILTSVQEMSISQKTELLNVVLPYVTTNFSKSEIISKTPEFSDYLSWPLTQYIVPKKANQYVMRDGIEVIIVDWPDTTEYIQSIMYDGVDINIE